MATADELPAETGRVEHPARRADTLLPSRAVARESDVTPSLKGTDRQVRILIVDDERHNRQLLEVMLAPQGFDIVTAANGEDALAMVARKPPDLILLDIMMPGMDGYGVAAKLKSEVATRNIPIIMVTALDSRDAKMFSLGIGAEEFLSKPVDRAELQLRVRNLLRLKAYGEALAHEVVSRTADLLALEHYSTAMHRSEERTDYALAAAHMGVWELDIATERLTWSTTMAPVFGLTPDLAPTSVEAFLTLIHPEDRRTVEESLVRAARERIDLAVEFRALLPDGSTRWVAGQARMLCDADGRPVRLLGIGADISDRKTLEAQLRQAQKMEAVGQLAGGVAHDFNNLLTAILGYSTFVIDTLGVEDERRSDMGEIIKAGQRASALTGQLLAFSRKQIVQPTAVDLNTLVTGMRDMLSRLIGEHVNLVPILTPDPCPVRADAGQVEQVLMNLVLNARDAMHLGGRLTVETANVTLESSVIDGVKIAAGDYGMLVVSDTGIGIDEPTKQRLFEPFFTTKEAGKGSGLGLATAHGIVKQSGGHISVHSEIGKGASFKVYFPCADGSECADETPVYENAAEAGTETVLVVEDQDAVRILTCRMLERAGYRVLHASNPQEAVALYEKDMHLVNLLVTDVVMPGSSGPRLFERLVRQFPELKVLYLSGYADDAIVQQGELEPDVDFLRKPFTADALNHRVRDILGHVPPE